MLKNKNHNFDTYSNYSFHFFITHIYGINTTSRINLMHYLESLQWAFLTENHYVTWYYIKKLIPDFSYIYNVYIFSLLRLLSLRTYRGFRSLFGYPVRGQKTWSNANTVRRFTPTLLLLKQNQLTTYSFHKYSITEVLTEYINYIWYLQWNVEWKSMRKNWKHHKFFKTNPSKFLKFDDIINFRIEHFTQEVLEKKKFKSHRKKKRIDKNVITGGFFFGFVGYYSKLLIKK